MAIFANFMYVEVGLKVVKMAPNFTCSCFLCISKDIDVRRNYLKEFLKNGDLYLREGGGGSNIGHSDTKANSAKLKLGLS